MIQATQRFSYLGIFFGVAVAMGYFAGHWLDGRLRSDPWFAIIGLLMGLAAGFLELIRLVKQAQKEDEDS